MPVSARERLIEAAVQVFHREGFRGTGIERVLQEAKVSRMTLYNHFKSKDELIVAALRRKDEEFRHFLAREVERRAKEPRERLLAVFDVLAEWVNGPDFCGCMFINAAAEFADSDTAIRRACAEAKHLTMEYMEELAREAGATEPVELAARLHLLLEGLVVTTQVSGAGSCGWPERANAMAALMIDQELGAETGTG